jgi:hypothetical protein
MDVEVVRRTKVFHCVVNNVSDTITVREFDIRERPSEDQHIQVMLVGLKENVFDK